MYFMNSTPHISRKQVTDIKTWSKKSSRELQRHAGDRDQKVEDEEQSFLKGSVYE